jgi:hypothetical protein
MSASGDGSLGRPDHDDGARVPCDDDDHHRSRDDHHDPRRAASGLPL